MFLDHVTLMYADKLRSYDGCFIYIDLFQYKHMLKWAKTLKMIKLATF